MVQKTVKTTKRIFDEEHEALRDKAYLEAERYELETLMMRELFEEEQKTKVLLGKVKKRTKFEVYGRKKLPRIVRIQLNYRRIQASTKVWDRSEPSIRVRVP